MSWALFPKSIFRIKQASSHCNCVWVQFILVFKSSTHLVITPIWFCPESLHVNSTWSIRDGPDEGGQHLDGGGGVGVTAQPVLHFPAEPVHDVLHRLIRETHGVQVLINLRTRHRTQTQGDGDYSNCGKLFKTRFIFTCKVRWTGINQGVMCNELYDEMELQIVFKWL